MKPDIRRVQSDIEKKLIENQDVIETAAQSLHSRSPKHAARFLTEYSENQASIMMDEWKTLGEFLLVKYADGNIKRERNRQFIDNGWGVPEKIDHPGYSEEFYRWIVRETGDRFRVPEE